MNQSQINERFWQKWTNSGAVSRLVNGNQMRTVDKVTAARRSEMAQVRALEEHKRQINGEHK
jgi:hypothetical protein